MSPAPRQHTLRLVTLTTDSMELICYLVDRAGIKRSENWFWVPETGMLRRWRMNLADALVATNKAAVETLIRERDLA